MSMGVLFSVQLQSRIKIIDDGNRDIHVRKNSQMQHRDPRLGIQDKYY